MLKLHVIITSTRPERQGAAVGRWFYEIARQFDGFDVELVDLREVDLPLFDEPKHPRLQEYANEHTNAWSRQVDAADAFVFVTPEYNHGPPPSLVNALAFLSKEWGYKPVGFVSYGGVSAGTRAVEGIKPNLTTLKMMPIPEAVSVPFFSRHIDQETGRFDPGEVQQNAADMMLGELARWANALKVLRD